MLSYAIIISLYIFIENSISKTEYPKRCLVRPGMSFPKSYLIRHKEFHRRSDCFLVCFNQKVVTFPKRNPNNFRRFLMLNLLHKLAVPSTNRYSSQMSSVSRRCWSSVCRSERESPETKPLSGRDNELGIEFNCWNQRATLAVDDN